MLGLAYESNVDDERESPSYVLMKLLAERGAEISYYDRYVPVIKPARDYSQFPGRKSVAWNRAMIENLISFSSRRTHSSVNYHELGEWARCNRGYAERDGGHARIARKSLEA
jgi:UDP-N-acetyl-D-glucosamine dehydrogenase